MSTWFGTIFCTYKAISSWTNKQAKGFYLLFGEIIIYDDIFLSVWKRMNKRLKFMVEHLYWFNGLYLDRGWYIYIMFRMF